MKNHIVKCSNFEIANNKLFTLIAGPCQLESEEHAVKISTELKKITKDLGINFIYKTSISKGIVMMCSKDNFYQEFVIEGLEFQKHKHNFLRRVDEYYKTRSKTIG